MYDRGSEGGRMRTQTETFFIPRRFQLALRSLSSSSLEASDVREGSLKVKKWGNQEV